MDVSAVSSGQAATQAKGAAKTLGKDDFLKLFVTQLRYQDPMSPMNSTDFTAQLAQFGSLEQLTNLSSQMKDMLLYQNSLQNTLTAGLIGKQVKISGDAVSLKGNAEITYNLSQDAGKVKLSLYDANGKLVREIEVGPQKSGNGSYTWDGKDSTGKTLPDGQYTVKVDAVDASGKALDATTTTKGTVTGISYDNNVTYLVIDGKTKVQLSDIKEINGGV